DAVLRLRIEIVLRGPARTAAIEAERPMVAPVGADLQHRLVLEEAVVALERHATAILAGARLVGNELVGQQLERLLGLGDLYRVRGHVGHHVAVAVEPVGPWPGPPGAAGEVDIDERLALGIVGADRDARVGARPPPPRLVW